MKNNFRYANILGVEPDLLIFPITQHVPIAVAILNDFEAVIAFDPLEAWCFVSFYSAEES